MSNGQALTGSKDRLSPINNINNDHTSADTNRLPVPLRYQHRDLLRKIQQTEKLRKRQEKGFAERSPGSYSSPTVTKLIVVEKFFKLKTVKIVAPLDKRPDRSIHER